MNRYFFIVGERFDYLYSEEELLNAGITNTDALIKYIEKEGKILKIQFQGNFVEEIVFRPDLFLEYDSVKKYFSEQIVIQSDEECLNKSYAKVDKEFFEMGYDNFESDEFIKDVVDYFPFKVGKDKINSEETKSNITEHNKDFGMIPSCYIVLEELKETIVKIRKEEAI